MWYYKVTDGRLIKDCFNNDRMMKNIDFVFVEFDDCLYLHKEHWEKEEDFDYYFDFESNNKKYKDSCLNLRLLEKLDKLKNKKCEHNVRVIMLTTSCISKQFEDKKNFVFWTGNGRHIFDDYVSVSNSDDKVKYITKYVEYVGDILKSNVIVIDNNISTLIQARKHLYKAFTPLYFCDKYEIK